MGYKEPYSGEYNYVYQQGVVYPTVHPLFVTWRMMNVRCYDSRHKAYHRYGGRGIEVDYQWRWDNPQGFINFISVVGGRPLGMTLDRVDNSLGYTSNNWKWSTKKEQQNNISIGLSNTTGDMGVSWCESSNAWLVQISLFGKTKCIGLFNYEDKELAILRYSEVKVIKIEDGDKAAFNFYLSLKDLTPTGKQKRRNKTSQYYGVAANKSGKWRAFTNEYVDGRLKQVSLGVHLTEEGAYGAVLKRRELTGV